MQEVVKCLYLYFTSWNWKCGSYVR